MDNQNKNQSYTSSALNIIAGLWTIISPYALSFFNANLIVNNVIIGGVIALLALIRLFLPSRASWISMVNTLLGVWLIISPFIFPYINSNAFWNNLIIGVVVVGLSLWNAGSTTTHQQQGRMT